MEEKVFIQNKKGLKLAATLYTPKKKGKFPGIIFLTGFSQNRNDIHVVSLCQELVKLGFASISFETAGAGESEGEISEFSLTNYYNDVDVIYEYFVSLPYVDREKIGLVGHSLGSVVTLLYAAKNPINIKALCAIMPFVHFSDLHMHIPMSKWQQEGFMTYTKSNGQKEKLPYSFVEDADRANVLDIVNNLIQPKLIIMSKADGVINPLVSQSIYDHASEPKELFVLDDVEHTYRKNTKGIEKVNKKVIAFFKENL